MTEYAEDEHEISLSELDDETLEAGLIARLVCFPSDYFLYMLMDVDASSFSNAQARRCYSAVVQGVRLSFMASARIRSDASIKVENLNVSETGSDISYLRKALAGGFPCGPYVPKCLLELKDRSTLRQLAEQEGLDSEWERVSQEYVPDDDSDDMPW